MKGGVKSGIERNPNLTDPNPNQPQPNQPQPNQPQPNQLMDGVLT